MIKVINSLGFFCDNVSNLHENSRLFSIVGMSLYGGKKKRGKCLLSLGILVGGGGYGEGKGRRELVCTCSLMEEMERLWGQQAGSDARN